MLWVVNLGQKGWVKAAVVVEVEQAVVLIQVQALGLLVQPAALTQNQVVKNRKTCRNCAKNDTKK